MFWIVLGAVGVPVAVVGAFDESEVVPSFDGLVDFVVAPFCSFVRECNKFGFYRSP